MSGLLVLFDENNPLTIQNGSLETAERRALRRRELIGSRGNGRDGRIRNVGRIVFCCIQLLASERIIGTVHENIPTTSETSQ